MHEQDRPGGLHRTGIDRRTFLGGATAAALPGALLLGACGNGSSTSSASGLAKASSAAAPGRKFAFSYPQTGGTGIEFFTPIFNGAKQAAKDLGVRISITSTATFDSVQQGRMVDAAVAARPDGIMTGVWDPDAMGGPIRTAVAQGIPVVVINAEPPGPAPFGALTYVGQDELLAGQQGGRRMRELGVTKALIANHDPSQVQINNRQNGFKAGFGGPTKVVVVSKSDPSNSQQDLKAAMQANPDFDGIFALSGNLSGEPALLAVNALGRQNKVKVATFDLSSTILKAVQNGQMLFAIDQQQYLQGYYPVLILTLYKQYGLTPPTGINFVTGPEFVTRENAAQITTLAGEGIR
jgi:simple sugar transport system substrate-binding protein